jgi:predicted nucleotidyltransferase
MISLSLDQRAAVAAGDFVRTVAPQWQATLGHELIGLYLLGSLAHGGFSRRYSDIDVALVTESGVTAAVLDRLRAQGAQVSAELAAKLSFFWTDRAFSIGRFPPLDRIDYLDRVVVLSERERVLPPRPPLAEIRAYLAGIPFSNWMAAADKFAAADALDPKDRKSYLRALLYPARFFVSFMTARMVSNDDAVAYLDACAPPGLDVDLVKRALACRQAAADPDPLFGERAALPRQVAACANFVIESAAEAP